MNFFKENNILANMSTSVLSQLKKSRKNIKSPRNYSSKTLKSSRLILKQLEPIYEDEASCTSNEKSYSFGNVVLEEIFFKENPGDPVFPNSGMRGPKTWSLRNFPYVDSPD